MTIHQFKILLGTLFVTLTLSACSDNGGSATPIDNKPYSYVMPEAKNDGWLVGHITDAGFDENQISLLVNDMLKGVHPGIDSLSIVRHGRLVLHENLKTEFSQYDQWVGNQDLDRHVMHSTSKSFVSALVGIAIDQGYLTSTDSYLLPFFDYPDYANWDFRKESLTIENVLTMQLGLEWDEWQYPFGDEQNSLTRLTENNDDFIKALLDLPLTSQPGTEFSYNTVASIALGALVEKATGQPLVDFAQQNLFQPLQIERADWLMTPKGLANTGSGLFLPTRDMAKFGLLYLNKGQWNGIQLISSNWVERSLSQSVAIKGDYTTGYGYQWWLGDFNLNGTSIHAYSTRGFGGQFIVVIPDYDLVIAFTAHNYDNDLYESPFKIIEQFILPAIVN